MMRKSWGVWGAIPLLIALVALATPASANAPDEPAPPARLLAIVAVEQSPGVSLRIEASAPFRFTSYQPGHRAVVVDLRGVVSDRAALEPAAGVPWIAGYRLLPFRNAGGQPVLRFDINLKADCAVEVTQPAPTALLLSCGEAVASAPRIETTPAPPAEPEPVPAAPPAVVAPASEEPAQVRRVSFQSYETGVRVDVEASAPLAYETMVLSGPARLVVDLPHSILASRQRQLLIDQKAILGVRVAQFTAEPPVTRLVVDLREMLPYEVNSTPDGLRVNFPFHAASALPEPAAATEEPVSAPASPPVSVSENSVPEGGAPPVLLASLAPTVPAGLRAAVAPSVGTELAEVAATPATVAPVVTPETAPANDPAPAAISPQAPSPAPAGQAPRRYTGEPISVNLKDVDLKDFFRLIHEISGLNIIVGSDVTGTVTLVLVDVPWDQALDIVLKDKRLGSALEGNVLRIATLTTLKKEQEEATELAKARLEAVETVTVSKTLSYAKAGDMETVLNRFLSSRGSIIRDDRTNTLIIRDIPSVIPEMENLIKQLDRKSLQVEIEARVVSASRAFMRQIGSQLATAFSTTRGRSLFGGALGPSLIEDFAPLPPLVSSGGTQAPLAVDLGVGGATSGFLFGHRSPNFALDVILTAAENRNIAKVLSKPRVITQNNVRSEVKQGTRIPVQTVVNNTISTQFQDVVLKLEVTPQITADGTVFLNIDIENTSIAAGIARINGIPALTTQRVTTQVLIEDGGTVVVGGVMVTMDSTTVDQVPLLGSIPVLGHLFKRTRVDSSTQELLFFITPRILPS